VLITFQHYHVTVAQRLVVHNSVESKTKRYKTKTKTKTKAARPRPRPRPVCDRSFNKTVVSDYETANDCTTSGTI